MPIPEGERVKVWYDACTGKQVRYGVAIARRLRARGHEVKLTTREHPDTLDLARFLREPFETVGKYDPSSQLSRLRESLKRQLRFCEMFEKDTPDAAISHRSVELCRVAFGLAIPSISTHDTVHADVINRLTMPLINYLVISKALPRRAVEGYGVKKIFWFDGVDEVAWIKGFKPEAKYDYPHPLILVRELETKAAYAKDKKDLTSALTKKLSTLGNVLFLQRYERRPEKGIIVPTQFVDSATVAAQADLVISAGGTIAREAVLQGTPAIVFKSFEKIHVNDYLSKKGFPIFTVNPDKVLDNAKKNLGKRSNVKHLLNDLENPLDTIEKIIEEEIKQ
jgi:predicted glycosyltransferase